MPKNNDEKIINKLPSIKENINDINEYGLIKENDKWNMMINSNIRCVSEDLLPNKLAEIDDGFDDLFVIPESKGGGKWPLLRFLLNDIDTGDLFEGENKQFKSGYNYHKTKWWRFIPKKRKEDPDDVNIIHRWEQYYSIDGERYPICPIQCKVLPKILLVYCGKY